MTADRDLIVMLAGCSLATKSGDKDNWVERAGSGGRGGELPEYICKIARAIKRGGKSRSQAIAIAVSRVKKWAAGTGEVNADTRAKSAKAVAEWESLKAKHAAKKLVKASRQGGDEYIMFSSTGEYNTQVVRDAWQAQFRTGSTEPVAVHTPYSYVREMWNSYLIVEMENGPGGPPTLLRVPYIVTGKGDVEFGEPVEVETRYVPVSNTLTSDEEALLADLLGGDLDDGD